MGEKKQIKTLRDLKKIIDSCPEEVLDRELFADHQVTCFECGAEWLDTLCVINAEIVEVCYSSLDDNGNITKICQPLVLRFRLSDYPPTWPRATQVTAPDLLQMLADVVHKNILKDLKIV